MNRLQVELWWLLERWCGRLWHKLGKDRASYWLDFLPAYAYKRRKMTEQRCNQPIDNTSACGKMELRD